MSFTPHYAVFSMPSSDPSVYQDLCSDTTGQYCAEDPDASGSVTGKDVLDENVRQLCIHELTKVAKDARQQAADRAEKEAEDAASGNLRGSQVPQQGVFFAEAYWQYVEKIPDRCPVTGQSEDSKFGYICSKKLMEEVGIDSAAVEKCVLESKEEKLKDQRNHQAWSPKAMRINGWRYTGMLDADLVTRAVCAGFVQKPAECESIVQARDPFLKYDGATVEEGVSFTTFLLGLAGIAAFSCATLMCYKKSVKDQVQASVREEVMLEVQNAMAQYNRMNNSDM